MFTKLRLTCLILLIASLTSCMTRSPNAPPVPAINHVARTVAVVAEINKGLTQTVIILNQNGKIKDDVTADILKYTGLVAQSCKSTVEIMTTAKTDQQKITAVLALMQQVSVPFPLLQKLNLSSPDMTALAALLNSLDLAARAVVSAVQGG